MMTPWTPPDYGALTPAQRTAVLARYVGLLCTVESTWSMDCPCDPCRRRTASTARLRALITGEGTIFESWIRAPRERVTA